MRLQGPVCNLFIVITCMSHRGRVCPSQDDTITDLQETLNLVPPDDYMIVLDDLNEQLGTNIKNRSDRWTGGKPSKNADKIVDLMRMHNLCAANEFFEPNRGESAHTHLCPTQKNKGAQGDFGPCVGERALCIYYY